MHRNVAEIAARKTQTGFYPEIRQRTFNPRNKRDTQYLPENRAESVYYFHKITPCAFRQNYIRTADHVIAPDRRLNQAFDHIE